MVLISILIPVKNGAGTIRKCLEGMFTQSVADNMEVIIIDSGSADGTLEIIKEFPVHLKQVPSEEFNHGATRNLGASMSQGEFIVMTVQDAIPVDNQWLEKMVRHFNDPEVAGVCGQQIVPHDKDKNPHEWFRPVNPPSIRSYQFKDFSEFEKLTPKEKRWVCGWDDVTAMYRASMLKHELPFEKIHFGEDIVWAKAAYKKGYKLVFDTSARVYHYHHTTFWQQHERKRIEYQQDKDHFALAPSKQFPAKLFLLIIFRNMRFNASMKWIWYNWQKVFAGWTASLKIK